MKLYLFYLIKNSLKQEIDVPFIYAISDEKRLAKAFKKTRDMSLFHYKVIECDRNDGMRMIDSCKDCNITCASFSEISGTKCDVICTWKEEREILLNQKSIILNLMSKSILDIRCFTKEGLKILNKSDYNRFYEAKRLRNSNLFLDFFDLDMTFDELLLFIRVYGWTLREDCK